jgi:hypothetical protein
VLHIGQSITSVEEAAKARAVQVVADGRSLRLLGAARFEGQPLEVRLFDITGREVLRAPATESIALDGLAEGAYLYRLEGRQFQQTGKVVVR